MPSARQPRPHQAACRAPSPRGLRGRRPRPSESRACCQEGSPHAIQLESLIISQNHLTELPPDLPLWPKLKILFVNANSLLKLPETFLQNNMLERINLARNSKCAIPSKHILEHLKKVIAANKGKYWAPDTL